MAQNATELSAAIALRSEQLKEAIDKIMNHQEDIQDDILELQRRKRSNKEIDEELLSELKMARNDASDMIGLLALERTELLDDLPVIRLATGKIKVIASDLEGDAAFIEQTAAKLRKATKMVQKAEKVLVRIIALAGKLV